MCKIVFCFQVQFGYLPYGNYKSYALQSYWIPSMHSSRVILFSVFLLYPRVGMMLGAFFFLIWERYARCA